jgi:hypothetical protein
MSVDKLTRQSKQALNIELMNYAFLIARHYHDENVYFGGGGSSYNNVVLT